MYYFRWIVVLRFVDLFLTYFFPELFEDHIAIYLGTLDLKDERSLEGIICDCEYRCFLKVPM